MTTFNTGNPLGSTDVYDRYDNSENLDNFSNGPLDAYPDRFGVSRQSLQGIRNASQYVNLGPYAAGLNFTALNQVFSYDAGSGAEFYAPGPAIALPYTTTGAGAGEIANFRSVGDAVLRSDLADCTKGADLVAFSAAEDYAAGTVGDRLNRYITVTDAPFNAVADGVTVNTAAVLAAAVAAGPRGAIYIPPMVKYDFNALMDDATMPVEVVVFDDSLINGGYLKDKLTGIFEKGDSTAQADTTYLVSSGHNAGIALDNTGKSASAGGVARNVGISWTGGRQEKGAIPGFLRPIAREEFTGAGSKWSKTLRKRAPWAAVAADYFRWLAGTVVAGAGEYCFNANKYYVSTGTGTTGATAPTHTSGSVSDGGVTWTFVQFSYDQGVHSINDLGRTALNSALGTFFRRDRMSVDDTGDMIYGYEPVGASKSVTLNYLPTDAGGASTGTKQIVVTTTGFTYLVDGATAGAFLVNGFNQRGLVKLSSTAAALDTTPTVANIGTLVLNNASAASVTTLDDGVTNQEVELVFQNGNTTLVHSSSFVLQGSANVTPTANSVVTLRRAPYSAIWIEVSRSIK